MLSRRAVGAATTLRLRRFVEPLATVAAATCALVAVLSFVIPAIRGTFTGELDDFRPLRYAGRAVGEGSDPYAFTVAVGRDHLTRSLGFDYPPVVAWLCRPLAALPEPAADGLWVMLLLGAAVATGVVVGRAALPESWPRARLGVAAALLFVPSTYNIWHGNLNAVVTLIVALAFVEWLRGHEHRCGTLIGVAALLKLAPVVLLLLLLRRGWWRGVLVGGATIAAGVAVGVLGAGIAATRTFVTEVIPLLGREDGWIVDQSWNAVANRLAAHDVLTLQPSIPWLRLAVLGIGSLALLVVAWQVRRGAAPREVRALEFGAGVMVMLLAGTVTWYEHWAHLLLPFAAVTLMVWRRGPRHEPALCAALAATMLVAVCAAPPLLTGTPFPTLLARSHTWMWWPWLQLTSLPAACLTWLLAATILTLRRHRPGNEVAPAAAH